MGLLNQVFSIPLNEEQHIIYAPLKSTAFICNSRMVNEIHDHIIRLTDSPPSADRASEAGAGVGGELSFLEAMDFFMPEIPPDDDSACPVSLDTVVLFLSNRCNLRCIYCYAEAGEHREAEMSWEVAKAAIDHVYRRVRELRLPAMNLGFHGGGEPTMNWRVLTMAVDYARSLTDGSDVRLNVCGSFNGVWPEGVLNFILNNFNGISLSFDGLDIVHDFQRPMKHGHGSFHEIAGTMRALDRSGAGYGIRMTITEQSVTRLAESVSFICDNFHPLKIQAEPVFAQGRASRNDLAIRDQGIFIDQFIAAYRIAEKQGIELFYSGSRLGIITTHFCLAPKNAFIVTPAGDVTTCFEIYSRDHPRSEYFMIGHYDRGRFVVDRGRAERNVRHLKSKTGAKPCHACFCRWHCAGDCVAKSMMDMSSQATSDEPRCFLNQELTKFLILDKIRKSGGLIWTATHERNR